MNDRYPMTAEGGPFLTDESDPDSSFDIYGGPAARSTTSTRAVARATPARRANVARPPRRAAAQRQMLGLSPLNILANGHIEYVPYATDCGQHLFSPQEMAIVGLNSRGQLATEYLRKSAVGGGGVAKFLDFGSTGLDAGTAFTAIPFVYISIAAPNELARANVSHLLKFVCADEWGNAHVCTGDHTVQAITSNRALELLFIPYSRTARGEPKPRPAKISRFNFTDGAATIAVDRQMRIDITEISADYTVTASIGTDALSTVRKFAVGQKLALALSGGADWSEEEDDVE